MSQKTKAKASDLRQMTFNYEKPCYRTKAGQKRLNELLAIPGIHRGSDSRFVTTADKQKTTQRRKA